MLKCYNRMMFNPFPSFLELGILAPLLLRITIGLFFIFLGKMILTKRRRDFVHLFKKQRVPLPEISSWLLGVATLFVGAFFLIGFMTQYASLVSVCLSIYFMGLIQRKIEILHHSYATYYFSILVALSLFILGAGPLAVDLPL